MNDKPLLQTEMRGRTYPFVVVAPPGPFRGGEFIGYGHQDATAFDVAALKYLDVVLPDRPVVVGWVEHEYGVLTDPATQAIVWDGITAETPGSFPITRLSTEVHQPASGSAMNLFPKVDPSTDEFSARAGRGARQHD